MKILISPSDTQLRPATRVLLERILCPLSGLTPHVAVAIRSPLEPKVVLAVGKLTGKGGSRAPELLLDNALHLAGVGTCYEEAMIGVLAESIERYAHFIWPASNPRRIVRASYQDMKAGSRVLVPENLQIFSETQLARPGFPFSPLSPDDSVGWVPASSFRDGAVCWVPAQTALVGYNRPKDEPLFMFGVSTGTAAHRTLEDALRSALLELIQIDAAMGNWFGNGSAVLIRHDNRTRTVDEIVRRRLCLHGPVPQFYWLPSADLAGLAVACVIESEEIPRCAVGLGCDLRLAHAMYKAFLEAAAVFQMAKAGVIQAVVSGSIHIDPCDIYDLDSNVLYYATQGTSAIRPMFGSDPILEAADLPPDVSLGSNGDVHHLLEGFVNTGKEVAFLDLTTDDILDLGFYVARVWSPDMLTLSLPSAPPMMQARFDAYGGIGTRRPHPYP